MILLTGDSSVEETDVAVAAGGEILQHSVARREAGKKKRTRGKRFKKGAKKTKRKRNEKNQKISKSKKYKENRNNRKESKGRKKKSKKQGTKRRGKAKKGKKTKSQKFNRNQRQLVNYTECAMQMKEFASRIKKAGNLERQAKRITDFKKINDNKKGKVKLGRHFHSCGISVLVERKF